MKWLKNNKLKEFYQEPIIISAKHFAKHFIHCCSRINKPHVPRLEKNYVSKRYMYVKYAAPERVWGRSLHSTKKETFLLTSWLSENKFCLSLAKTTLSRATHPASCSFVHYAFNVLHLAIQSLFANIFFLFKSFVDFQNHIFSHES